MIAFAGEILLGWVAVFWQHLLMWVDHGFETHTHVTELGSSSLLCHGCKNTVFLLSIPAISLLQEAATYGKNPSAAPVQRISLTPPTLLEIKPCYK